MASGSKETKFGYGFLLAGFGLPYLIDKLLGPVPALLCSAVALLAGVGFLIAGHLDRDKQGAQRRKGVMATVGMFTLIGAASGGLIGSITGAIWTLARKPEIISEQSTVSLQARLVPLPIDFEPGATARILNLLPDMVGLQVISFSSVGQNRQWPTMKPDIRDYGYRCDLTNHGSTPLFSVEVPLKLRLKQAVKIDDIPGISYDAQKTGAILDEYTREIKIPRLDANGGSFTFYIHNENPQFAELLLPQEISAEPMNQKSRVAIPMKQVDPQGWIYFVPFQSLRREKVMENPAPPKNPTPPLASAVQAQVLTNKDLRDNATRLARDADDTFLGYSNEEQRVKSDASPVWFPGGKTIEEFAQYGNRRANLVALEISSFSHLRDEIAAVRTLLVTRHPLFGVPPDPPTFVDVSSFLRLSKYAYLLADMIPPE